MNWETRIDIYIYIYIKCIFKCFLQCIQQITNEDLQYGTEDSILCSLMP